jgi:hypothetical protein
MLIRQLAGLNRIDMLIHVSVHDLQRNLRRYANREDSPLDRFALRLAGSAHEVRCWSRSVCIRRTNRNAMRQTHLAGQF